MLLAVELHDIKTKGRFKITCVKIDYVSALSGGILSKIISAVCPWDL
jgi:hypothetical protein